MGERPINRASLNRQGSGPDGVVVLVVVVGVVVVLEVVGGATRTVVIDGVLERPGVEVEVREGLRVVVVVELRVVVRVVV